MLIEIRPVLAPVDAEFLTRRAVIAADSREVRVWDIDCSDRDQPAELCWARRHDGQIPVARLAAHALRAAGELWVHEHGRVDLAGRWSSDAWRRLDQAETAAARGDLARAEGGPVPASTAPLFGR